MPLKKCEMKKRIKDMYKQMLTNLWGKRWERRCKRRGKSSRHWIEMPSKEENVPVHNCAVQYRLYLLQVSTLIVDMYMLVGSKHCHLLGHQRILESQISTRPEILLLVDIYCNKNLFMMYSILYSNNWPPMGNYRHALGSSHNLSMCLIWCR